MSTILTSVTNGVSFGYTGAISADADTDGELTVDFQVQYPIAAIIQIQNASGVNVDLSDAVITYGGSGQVTIADGAATFAVTAGDIINVLANRNKLNSTES